MRVSTQLKWIAILLFALALPLHAQPSASLNLKDADIRTLIDTVSQVTGKNFVVDPRVKAKVTVVSSRPMEKEELYQVFLSILEVHGFAAVTVGEVIKIIPDVNAKQGPVPTVSAKRPGIGDELVTRVIQLNHVPAAQLVPILRPLVPQQGQLAAYAPTNVLLISDRAANIERLMQIVRRIDRADSEEIEMIALQHASATEVVRIITSLQQKDQKGAPVPGQPTLIADERTNSVLLSGDRPGRLRLRGIIAHLDTPLETGGNTQVYFLKYARAADFVPLLEGIATGQVAEKGKAAPQTSETRIQADEQNNALVITAPPDVQRELQAIIRQLDIRRAQVLVEGILADVSTDLATLLGVQWAVDGLTQDGQGPLVITNFPSNSVDVPGLIDGDDPLSTIPSGFTSVFGDIAGSFRWAGLIRALEGDAATNILATPTLVTLDNEEAEFVVAQEVPFLTGSFTGAGSEDPDDPFQTIERKDVGLTLKIKPQINEGNSVRLSIDQEVSNLAVAASAAVNASDLITNRRAVKTNVLVDNDQIIVLSGLIQEDFRDSVEKVPLLGDIPVLGHLFKVTDTQKTKNNLMIFIHPVILRDVETANVYTRAKYNLMRAQQIDADLDDRGVLRHPTGNLPEIEELITRLPPPSMAPDEGEAWSPGEGIPEADTP